MSRAAFLWNPNNASHAAYLDEWKAVAQLLGVELLFVAMATGREVKAGRLATATRREQQHNLSGMARILLNGDFTFCLICDFNELDVAQ
jgi:hypothetical protein